MKPTHLLLYDQCCRVLTLEVNLLLSQKVFSKWFWFLLARWRRHELQLVATKTALFVGAQVRIAVWAVVVCVAARVGAVWNATKDWKRDNEDWEAFAIHLIYLHAWPRVDERRKENERLIKRDLTDNSIVTHQQIKRHKINAIMCVFPEASCSTLVEILAWQLGHCKRVESGPTATFVSENVAMEENV